jgi:hypothetical protein
VLQTWKPRDFVKKWSLSLPLTDSRDTCPTTHRTLIHVFSLPVNNALVDTALILGQPLLPPAADFLSNVEFPQPYTTRACHFPICLICTQRFTNTCPVWSAGPQVNKTRDGLYNIYAHAVPSIAMAVNSMSSLHQTTPLPRYLLHFKNNTHILNKDLWMARAGMGPHHQDDPPCIPMTSRWVVCNPNLQQ